MYTRGSTKSVTKRNSWGAFLSSFDSICRPTLSPSFFNPHSRGLFRYFTARFSFIHLQRARGPLLPSARGPKRIQVTDFLAEFYPLTCGSVRYIPSLACGDGNSRMRIRTRVIYQCAEAKLIIRYRLRTRGRRTRGRRAMMINL